MIAIINTINSVVVRGKAIVIQFIWNLIDTLWEARDTNWEDE